MTLIHVQDAGGASFSDDEDDSDAGVHSMMVLYYLL